MTQPRFQRPGGRTKMCAQASWPPDSCATVLWGRLASGLARATARPESGEEEEARGTPPEVPEPPFAAGQPMRFPGTCSFSPSPARLAKEHWQPMAASVSLKFKAASSSQRWETQADAGSAAKAEVQQGCQQVTPGAQSSQTYSLPTVTPTHTVWAG